VSSGGSPEQCDGAGEKKRQLRYILAMQGAFGYGGVVDQPKNVKKKSLNKTPEGMRAVQARKR